MQVYWLTDQSNGEEALVDGDTVERLLGVELGYVEWCIDVDGVFENGKWRLLGGKQSSIRMRASYLQCVKTDIHAHILPL